jgi:tetratricopeptide (TPR) repeat protein
MSSAPRPIDVAYTLHVNGRLEEAEAKYRAIIADDPAGQDGMDARNNLVGLFQSQHRWDEAQAVIREALEVRPRDGDWSFRLAASLLAEGRYAEGWPLYEARRATGRNRVTAPQLPFPEWQGQPIRSLLVWPEQGFGDVIQFSRFLPAVRARGIAVTLVVRRPLVRLLSPLADQVVALEDQMRLPVCEAWALIASLPRLLGGTLETLPPPALAAAPEGGPGIGVTVRGRVTHINDTNRSLPEDLAAELLALPGAVSLDPADTGAADFQETAEIIAGLERVISVDTAQAHLAASLGKPTAILLPWLNPDWRWLRERSDSPWYPSATLYRQPAAGDWRSAIDAVKRDVGAS